MNDVNRWGLAAGLAAALALFGNALAQGAAGSERSGATGSGSRSEMEAKPKVDKGLQEKLEKIHAANRAEVQMAQLGAQNAQSPEVKQFAEQMQADHQGLDQKLTQTAQSAGFTLEGKTFQKENERAMKDMEKLQSKTGAEFDKELMSRIVKDHEKAVKDTESAAKDARKANQTELASLLEGAHTGMKSHLEHAKQLRASVAEASRAQQRQGRAPPSGGTGSAAPPPSGGAPGTPSGSGEPQPKQ